MDKKHIVIVGCGRLGSSLANDLSADGHRVIVIDNRKHAFDKLSAAFSGFQIAGDATELQTLKDAEIGKADCLFATTTEDNTNLMVAQIARTIFDVSLVVARVYDPQREAVYSNFGVETVSPTRLSAGVFHELINKKPAKTEED
jgi:trk system potassium uptake protein TrkA